MPLLRQIHLLLSITLDTMLPYSSSSSLVGTGSETQCGLGSSREVLRCPGLRVLFLLYEVLRE
jgi:hypothetical protein